MNADAAAYRAPLRVVALNSLLTGGGTDDQCVKLAARIHRMGERMVIAGPSGRVFSKVIAEDVTPFVDTGERSSKLGFILRAAKVLRNERAQIVHGHHGRDLWPTVLAARFSGVRPKIVLTRHLAKSPGSWAGRRWLLGHCDAMIACSEFVARVLREGVYEPKSPEAERRSRPPMRGDHSKIRVIYCGIDATRFRPMDATFTRKELGLEPDHYAFAVIGGFDRPRGKGQREFLAAAARVITGAPNARFLIIGRGSLGPTLQDDIVHLGLASQARLTGQVSNMPEVMNAIDCMVHPQIGTEAFPLVVCEAHACGKPVIASNLDGIPEAWSAGGRGALVDPENVPFLAETMAVQEALPRVTPADAEEMHARVEAAYSIERSAANVLQLYQELVGRTPPEKAG